MAVSVNNAKCLGCSLCVLACPEEAVTAPAGTAEIDHEKCVECADSCPVDAIEEVPS